MRFDGILFFPVTPFAADGPIDHDLLAAHVEAGVAHGAGGVFPACGTGEFHALSAAEATAVVRTAVSRVGGRVPVVAGTGGPLGHALEVARGAADAGADALLVLPPYLVGAPAAGLIAYVEAVIAASDLPVIVYHRANARYTPDAMRRLAQNPRVVGFKDGIGDIGTTQLIVRAVAEAGRPDFAFFNGLLTAELTQAAFRGIGVELYSSAAFAMAPEIATAFYRASTTGDDAARLALLDRFYTPLVNLRDETPGFGVSLIKAGLRLQGVPVGGVRAPLVDPTADQERRLAAILDAGRALL
ncbi:5-dehydro-4-deoxyglucarate dehydratase [Microbacterium imperiale]|uniref:Probable 5-dehydro-4-deoxyglucarate dehydratase n=1 Tax=Microbacterium imperiale TaxID=33884 RepID=A0A9W6HIL8_9MICO|nr:5-dehydro-4-deoxyglucarate dehydratase [Microbacterium imperiale]MBP2421472.1 5-dehydro-4-deoxyglucarate dehydratase [Microbacterium imperiale]MDS0199421.1 5-dehydro-4-deoxyglucarate dehydratase [Microbacterium imperiale]BFE41811.1 5-dehydro-4-deoxyglucarate dehydratase [Microbacterium imperiale]GLJ80763.1 putative 5-dehydro-4-deoxyglucarate dehydratase [Microbacterium imperiale]